MPKWCAIGTCSNHHLMLDEVTGKQKYSFYRFPKATKDKVRRDKWSLACGRFMPGSRAVWKPSDDVIGVYICSEHFITGQ